MDRAEAPERQAREYGDKRGDARFFHSCGE
jgi:hypothetical protein